jgi:hypothetical protein
MHLKPPWMGWGPRPYACWVTYALSKALGLKYLHTPPQGIGGIGGLPNFSILEDKDCSSKMTAADHLQLPRVQRLLSLPSSAGLSSSSSSNSWHVERLDDVMVTWEALRDAAQSALSHKRPTLIKLARVHALLYQHPDVFLAVPQLQPKGSNHHKMIQGVC